VEPIAVVTILTLIEYFVFSLLVARSRIKTGTPPPTIVGDPIFERYFRVHQNTLEQLVVFLPALWLFGIYVDALIGAVVGLLFIVGRAIYCRGYVEDPSKRTLGFVIGQLSETILLLGGLIGAIVSWL
jgi:glutathione S-transferase